MSEIEGMLETRTSFYGFLYRMYVEEPTREFANDLTNGKFDFAELVALDINPELSEGFRLLNAFMDKSKGKDGDTIYKALRDEYTLLFIGPGRLPVEPYEAWWVSGKRLGEPLVKVIEAYRKAGIVRSKEYPEPEDYIGFELKFLHYLCEEEMAAESRERLKECLKLQREFFDEHVLKWVPNFCDALYNYKLSNFYKGIAKLTKGFILFDSAVISDLLDSLQ